MRLPTLLASLTLLLPATALAQAASETGQRQFHIATVHLDGVTGIAASPAHPAEAFPSAAMPPGGGLLLSPPDAEGNWRFRAFVFQPAQLVIRQGETVTLTFMGVQGSTSRIEVEGQGEPFTLHRGEIRNVTLTADRPGVIAYRSLDHMPSMTGEILVLPR